MKKYATVQVEVTRECAYCNRLCDYKGIVYVKWGQADAWECPTHGMYYEMTSPMLMRGEQIGPTL